MTTSRCSSCVCTQKTDKDGVSMLQTARVCVNELGVHVYGYAYVLAWIEGDVCIAAERERDKQGP